MTTPTELPTPRTDALQSHTRMGFELDQVHEYILSFARQLERELSAAHEREGRLVEALTEQYAASRAFVAAYWLWSQRRAEYDIHRSDENARAVSEASMLQVEAEDRLKKANDAALSHCRPAAKEGV